MGKARKHGRRLMIRGAVGKAISQFATTPLPLWLDSLRALSLLPSLMGEDYACCPAGGSNREALPAAAASLGIVVFDHAPSRKVIFPPIHDCAQQGTEHLEKRRERRRRDRA